MSELKIKAGGKYLTRDGREARVYTTDGGGDFPVHGAFLRNGEWVIEEWNLNGGFNFFGLTYALDLVSEIEEGE